MHTMNSTAAFLAMLDYNREQVKAALLDAHPYETEADMDAAIEQAFERKERFESDMSDALDADAIREEHRG